MPFLFILFVWIISVPTLFAAELPLHLLKVTEGFKISIFATSVPNAREMALGDKGTVFVGSLGAGKVAWGGLAPG
ncbi:hypothetical protein OQJ15_15100 [Fluoribacter dumoffii]|uniref:Uncharacterized protein n=1 Tax=Fluoribacter dumoffii TaxID=463 RepID=A0A377GDQ7_9GAMM|nr:hypothetical protein [Fluoribacter dumoffii]KTC91198.1 L-sorbosone dehydrogenase [Fluoribacter dumoffii NY 23]MCW8387634.1 hypothetical protein [Fluoribacter dumoffii]MCW8497837.1 hypothetical protein [Fluoribacter dumoffii]STO22894.1 Uncharacterised protein [Fluoribacter dumoffii]